MCHVFSLDPGSTVRRYENGDTATAQGMQNGCLSFRVTPHVFADSSVAPVSRTAMTIAIIG